MTAHGFFAASNVLIVAGKGGVGKTTVGAALAFAAAQVGYDVLLIELEGYSNLGPSLGLDPLEHEAVTVDQSMFGSSESPAGRLRAMQLRPDEALADYLDQSGLGSIIRRFSRSEAVEVVVAAAPGLRDLVTLGKIRQLEEAGTADLIVVDAPASGHALSLLTSATGMADSTTSGPIKEQADKVLALLDDEERCRVLLVTLPEETPITETIETAFTIEDEIGVKLGPVVVNGVWPPVDGLAEAVANEHDEVLRTAALFRLAKMADQAEQIRRLADELPLPQIHLPLLFTAAIDQEAIVVLGQALLTSLADGAGAS